MMTQMIRESEFGTVSEPMTLTIQRMLPGPIERCWAYLSESDLRKKWLAAGEMTMEVGSSFEFIWRNEELATAPSKRPEGAPEEHRMTCTITELDAPHKLGFTWNRSGGVTFELAERGDKVLLTITHHKAPDRSTLLAVSAGWHQHVDTLLAAIEGRVGDPFWEAMADVRKEYEKRIPAE